MNKIIIRCCILNSPLLSSKRLFYMLSILLLTLFHSCSVLLSSEENLSSSNVSNLLVLTHWFVSITATCILGSCSGEMFINAYFLVASQESEVVFVRNSSIEFTCHISIS
jgi:hypothetical protein